MSFQKGESKSTQTTSFPQYVEDAQRGLITAAGGMATPFIQPPNSALAGQNADQMKAAELARQQAAGAFSTDYSKSIAKAGETGYSPYQITGEDIQNEMNPYLQSVGRQTLADLRREKTATDAQIGARAASGVAFGGSGPALQRAQLDRTHGEQVGSTINSLLAQGYDRATAIAMQKAAAENAARASNSQMGLASQIAANSAANSTFERQQAALQQLMGIGNQNQQFAQAGIDIPWTQLNKVAAFLPGVGSTQTNAQPNYFNPLEALMGVGSLL